MDKNLNKPTLQAKIIFAIWSTIIFVLLCCIYHIFSDKNSDNPKFTQDVSTVIENDQIISKNELQAVLSASIDANYFVPFVWFEKNTFSRDDILYRKDHSKVSYNYIFSKSPKFTTSGNNCKLDVTFERKKLNIEDIEIVLELKSSYDKDIYYSSAISTENITKLKLYDESLGEQNFRLSESNIKNIMRWLAAKNNCELDIQFIKQKNSKKEL